MTIKYDCDDYRLKRIKRNRPGTMSVSYVEIHECYHPKNHIKGGKLTLVSKTCNTENDYCPYNPTKKD